MKCLGLYSSKAELSLRWDRSSSLFHHQNSISLSLAPSLAIIGLWAIISGRLSPHICIWWLRETLKEQRFHSLLEVISEKKRAVLVVKVLGRMLNGLGWETCPVFRPLPWLQRCTAQISQQGACWLTHGRERKSSSPRKKRVGSMGNRPKLAAIIHYPEIDETQNQGIITQCKVIKVNNRRTEK